MHVPSVPLWRKGPWDVLWIQIDCKQCGVTEHPRGAIFSCFHGNSIMETWKYCSPGVCAPIATIVINSNFRNRGVLRSVENLQSKSSSYTPTKNTSSSYAIATLEL